MSTKVAAVVLNWRNAEITIRCVKSLQMQLPMCPDIIVVDNGSQDGSYEELQARLDGALVIGNRSNLGYGGGNNVGIMAALERGAEWVWVLNNDTEAAPDCLDRLLGKAVESGPGVVVPRILLGDGTGRLWYDGGHVNRRKAEVVHWGWRQREEEVVQPSRDLTFATGCSLLIHRDVLTQIGGFEETLFLYWEDVEFSDRVLGHGFPLSLASSARLFHDVGGSSDAEDELSAVSLFYCTRNRLLYVRSALNWKARLLPYAWTVRTVARDLRRVGRLRRSGRGRLAYSIARGLAAGIFHRTLSLNGGTATEATR